MLPDGAYDKAPWVVIMMIIMVDGGKEQY